VRRTPSFGDSIVLKPDEFRLLRDLFVARTGLQFGADARFALERRLRERLMVLKLATFADYHHYLRFGTQASAEWDEAVDLLTTNETYFFREDRQLRAFKNEVLPMLEVQSRSRRRIAVWSAGCSTGEEAYTLGIILHQSTLFPHRGRTSHAAASPPRAVASTARAVSGRHPRRCAAPSFTSVRTGGTS
jgi:chemotaxis protein methyltransferase CheR